MRQAESSSTQDGLWFLENGRPTPRSTDATVDELSTAGDASVTGVPGARGPARLIVPLPRRNRERFEVEVRTGASATPTSAGSSAFVDARLAPETADSATLTG